MFNDYNCVWLPSPEVSRKRQSQEERDYGETPQEKKLRLAKLYLDQLKEEGKPRATHTHRHFLKCQNMTVCLLLHVFLTEENKAENDSFEADLIAGRLQEEVVRLKRFPKVTLVFPHALQQSTSTLN